jgi:hypothetical protein
MVPGSGSPLAGLATLADVVRAAVASARPGDVIVGVMQMIQRRPDLGAMISAGLDARA